MSYRIGVDIGGTFTDCVVVDEQGVRSTAKALTTPDQLERGVLDALELAARVRGCSRAELLASTEVLVHGTTQATNALVTRTGARTGLITTSGHEDAIVIGRVYAKAAGLPERALIHSSRLSKPESVVEPELIRGITERIDRDGEEVVALDEEQALAAIESLMAEGVEAIAVCLLWSFANDRHERRIAELLVERLDGEFVSCSYEVAPRMGEYERAATTAVNAYVGPKVAGYIEALETALRSQGLSHPLLVMQGNGGLTSADDAAHRPIVTVDSGPAGGILGCRRLAERYGEPNVICTDVGGTTFDVGLILAGEVLLDPEPVLAQHSLRLPKVLVRSIGAGGGSIAWVEESRLLRVGPRSAGARPGPVCYGFGGQEPTVTDADLVLGYLSEEAFLGGRMPLSRDLALEALERLGRRLRMSAEEVAAGVARIVNAQMADLIRSSTIERGHDPRDCITIAYGGAGPTHAVFYAEESGSKAVLVPAESTVFSAVGILDCDVTHSAELSRRMVAPYREADLAAVSECFAALERRVLAQFEQEGIPAEQVSLARYAGMRFRAQVHTIEVPVEPAPLTPASMERLEARFIERYGRRYGEGAVLPSQGTELELHRVVGVRANTAPKLSESSQSEDPDPGAAVRGRRPAYFASRGFVDSIVFDGGALRSGHVVPGPALIERMGDTVVVPPGYAATVDRHLTLWIGPPT